MALFFNFKTQSEVKASILHTRWHPLHPLLGVATGAPSNSGPTAGEEAANGAPSGQARVTVYNEEGDKVGTHLSRGSACSCMAWHPRARILCSGWQDGWLHLWNEDPAQCRELPNPHQQRQQHISCCCWTSSGDRILTADRGGVWAVWKFDQLKKSLQALVNNKESPMEGQLTHAAFRTRPRDRLVGTAAEAEDAAAAGEGERKALQKLKEEELNEEADGLGDLTRNLGGAFVVTRFNEDATWYVGGSAGNVWGIDEDGTTGVIFNMDKKPIISVLFHFSKTGVVAMNDDCSVAYYVMMDDHRWIQQMKFKISLGKGADKEHVQTIWIGNGIMGTCAQENMIRCWNIEANEMYVIQMESGETDGGPQKPTFNEKIMCIGYNARKRVVCGGTREGRVVFWQYVGGEVSRSEEDWEPFAEIGLEAPVNEIAWGPGENLLSASMREIVSVLHETALKRKMHQGNVVVQLTPDTMHFEDLNKNIVLTTRSQLRVKGVDLAGHYFVVWNSKEIELFLVTMGSPALNSVGYVKVENTSVALHNTKVLVTRIEKGVGTVEVYDLQMRKLSHLTIKAHEGLPQHLSVNGEFLVAATHKNYIRCWWIGGRAGEDKVHMKPKLVWDQQDRMEISNIAVNCEGTRVAIMAKKKDDAGHTSNDPRVHVFDMTNDKLVSYDFSESDRFPVSLFWDEAEPRLLACETRKLRQTEDAPEITGGDEEGDAEGPTRMEIAAMFANEQGVKLQEQFPLDKTMTALVGVSVPNFYVYCRDPLPRQQPLPPTHVVQRRMRDFEGIDCTEPKVKEAMLSFSFNLAMGDMDSAYRSVKLIRDENVWTNMAHMCVKTRRLDVAEVCLGNMQDAKGARALREARKQPEVESHVAMLAIQLGSVDEAEKLYKKCGRFDLLNQLYQAQNKWDQAVSVAEQHDRIHLRTVHYCHARHLESLGQVDEAIKAYERAKCHGYEVPRMLFDLNMIDDLERYVGRIKDRDVYTWWAQFCESNQQYETALHFYREANDMLSLVRLYCFLNDFETASGIVEEHIHNPDLQSQTQAAAFHLARQYEERGVTKECLQFFRLARAYKNAIRIARANDELLDVMQLSLQADNATVIESAQWFEDRKLLDKAVTLYQKGGEQSKAIELCIQGELFDVLQKLADNLDKDTDPDVFVQCGEFFASKGQHEKAAAMYIQAKSYDAALQLCIDHNVKLTEDMAEEMTLPKTENEDDEVVRNTLLKKIAKVAKLQESWHLACKKYTQAGDRLKGMKVLLKSGDTERIVFFTNHSRQKEIYIVAANYLQTLDWHNQPNLTKNIISFYQKARAWESLAGFHDAMAQVDIDEYRDYEKSLGGLREAYKYLEKSKASAREQKLEQFQQRIRYVEQFVEARNLVKADPSKMVELCQQLLTVDDVEGAVRVGDVFALLVEFYTQQNQHDQAYQLIEKMRDRQIQLSYYLEAQLIQNVYREMGMEYQEQEVDGAAAATRQPRGDDAGDDGIDDEVDEDIAGGDDD